MLSELRALRGSLDEVLGIQRQILALLRPRTPPTTPVPSDEPTLPSFADEPAEEAAAPPPLRTRRRRKTVLLVDDDEETRRATLAALEEAQVPTRVATDGKAALEAVAAEKPDVIVMELGISGAMAGKDVINMIKATMEWVDIPIVLYTRIQMDGQKEARTVHGGDEWVPKGPGAPEQLVRHVVQIFQKASYN